MKRPLTLSSILLVNLLLALSLYIISMGALTLWTAKSSVWKMYDEDLISDANVLLFITQKELQENNATGAVDLDITSNHLRGDERATFNEHSGWKNFRIWYQGRLATFTDNAMPASVPAFQQGFSNTVFDGKTWRVYSLHVLPENIIVEVAEQYLARDALVENFAQGMVWPFLLSLPLAAFIFWHAIRRGISSLHRLASQVDKRSPTRMTPLETESLPPDLLPLASAINMLLTRLEASLARERHLTDHAAHELRTPLTAIKLQVQMAMRADNEAERTLVLDKLLQSVDRSSHIVEQLMTLTRVEQSEFAMRPVDAVAVIHQLLADLHSLIEKKGLAIIKQLPHACMTIANVDLLYITLSNVISNAIKYSPERGTVHIVAMQREKDILVSIADQGPGIPSHLYDKVFERFYRNDRKETGSGLGLTIVKQCLERIRGSIAFHAVAAGRGLSVEISLPAAS